MSSQRRRREIAEQMVAEAMERMEEARRKEALTMYARIEEADASDDVKDILHRIATYVRLEE